MFSYLRCKIKKFSKWKKEEVDEFDWEEYPKTYKKELVDLAKICTQTLNCDDYVYKNSELMLNRDILPLHPNHKMLYETILQLSPSPVIELGCGGGDHLRNINTLAPEIKLYGRDISTDQTKLLKERHPELGAEI
jgi:tRNA G46 methylase TrmB